MAGHLVLTAKDEEFVAVYWAVDGRVYHLGAVASVDLTDLVRRLARNPGP